MNWNEFLTNIIGGIVGGGIVAITLQLYLNKKEKKKEGALNIVKSRTTEKIITDSILWDLKPGNSIAQMREILGTYTRKTNSDCSVFGDKEIETNSYLYIVNNAYIKITSRDDITIDTLTILPFGIEFRLDSIANVCDENENRFNIMKVCKSLIDNADEHVYIGTRIDSSFALKLYFSNPLYQYFTYFGFAENSFEYLKNNDPNTFLDGVINGICISNISEEAYFIYDQETR